MKKVLCCLLILIPGLTSIIFGVHSVHDTIDKTDEPQVYCTDNNFTEMTQVSLIKSIDTEPYSFISEEETETETVIARTVQNDEQNYIFLSCIPLSDEEQMLLQDACIEFNIPYALALGLVEKETNFRNVVGDDGASVGYMQIQQKWHRDRMDRLGVTDLTDPGGNFRVGLDFLSELYNKYHDWGMALTVYNMGHNPGYITKYANKVLNNYETWQAFLLGNI